MLQLIQTSFWYSLSSFYFSALDTIFQDIPQVICYIDAILVTRADDEDHLQNLAEFLKHLQFHGYQNKKSKYHFLETSVVYLGHQIDSERIHATADKVKAMVSALSYTCARVVFFTRAHKQLSEVLAQFGLSATTSELTATARM